MAVCETPRRRTPHGVRGLKWSDLQAIEYAGRRRTPHGVRGLKCNEASPEYQRRSRTPHGVRGLKWSDVDVRSQRPASHPSRGAWIEIPVMEHLRLFRSVAPLTGCVD